MFGSRRVRGHLGNPVTGEGLGEGLAAGVTTSQMPDETEPTREGTGSRRRPHRSAIEAEGPSPGGGGAGVTEGRGERGAGAGPPSSFSLACLFSVVATGEPRILEGSGLVLAGRVDVDAREGDGGSVRLATVPDA